MELTASAGVWIEERRADLIVYRAEDGDRWAIRGVCSGCGICDGDFPHSGPPAGRLDIPVRPEGPPSWPGCTLAGEYL